jgi:hypothetical protein
MGVKSTTSSKNDYKTTIGREKQGSVPPFSSWRTNLSSNQNTPAQRAARIRKFWHVPGTWLSEIDLRTILCMSAPTPSVNERIEHGTKVMEDDITSGRMQSIYTEI